MPRAKLVPNLSSPEAVVVAAYQVYRPSVKGGVLVPELMSCRQQTMTGRQLHSPR